MAWPPLPCGEAGHQNTTLADPLQLGLCRLELLEEPKRGHKGPKGVAKVPPKTEKEPTRAHVENQKRFFVDFRDFGAKLVPSFLIKIAKFSTLIMEL